MSLLPSYRPLRRTGLAIAPLALGTMNFGAAARGTPEPEAHAILDAFLALGGNFVDTADVYNGGASERVIGTWLSQKSPETRNSIILATKVSQDVCAHAHAHTHTHTHTHTYIHHNPNRKIVSSVYSRHDGIKGEKKGLLKLGAQKGDPAHVPSLLYAQHPASVPSAVS